MLMVVVVYLFNFKFLLQRKLMYKLEDGKKIDDCKRQDGAVECF